MARFLLRRRMLSPFLINPRCSFRSRACGSVEMEFGSASAISSPQYSVKLPTFIPSSGDHLVDFSVELVDHGLWPLSPCLANSVKGMDASSMEPLNLSREMVGGSGHNSSVMECSDFDVIDDLRVQKKLFYKLDRDSKEFEECNIEFHRKKSLKKKQEKLARADLKKERKKLERSNLSKKPTQASQKNESKKLEKPGQKSLSGGTKPLKQKNGASAQERESCHSEGCGDGVQKPLIEGKKVRTPTFNQLTDPYHLPFCLDIYISKGSVRACIVHRVTSKVVAVAHSISKDMKFDLTSRKDANACAAVGGVLAQRAMEDDIYNVVYTPRKGDKIEGKLQIVLQSIIDNGIDVKVKLKQKRNLKGRRKKIEYPNKRKKSGRSIREDRNDSSSFEPENWQ